MRITPFSRGLPEGSAWDVRQQQGSCRTSVSRHFLLRAGRPFRRGGRSRSLWRNAVSVPPPGHARPGLLERSENGRQRRLHDRAENITQLVWRAELPRTILPILPELLTAVIESHGLLLVKTTPILTSLSLRPKEFRAQFSPGIADCRNIKQIFKMVSSCVISDRKQ